MHENRKIISPVTTSFRFVIDYEHSNVQSGYRRRCENVSIQQWNFMTLVMRFKHRLRSKAALVTVAFRAAYGFAFLHTKAWKILTSFSIPAL